MNILLTGGSGKLGSVIRKSGLFSNLLAPSREELDIGNEEAVRNYIENHDLGGIIHAAALVDMATCEKNPADAIITNIVGTANLVRAVLAKNEKMRFVHISTDQLYGGGNGNYKETDPLKPHNK